MNRKVVIILNLVLFSLCSESYSEESDDELDLNIEEEFVKFLEFFHKFNSDFSLFKENLKDLEKFKYYIKNNHFHFQVGLNPFSDVTYEDFERTHFL